MLSKSVPVSRAALIPTHTTWSCPSKPWCGGQTQPKLKRVFEQIFRWGYLPRAHAKDCHQPICFTSSSLAESTAALIIAMLLSCTHVHNMCPCLHMFRFSCLFMVVSSNTWGGRTLASRRADNSFILLTNLHSIRSIKSTASESPFSTIYCWQAPLTRIAARRAEPRHVQTCSSRCW
jgi:hypothetical protein